MTEAAAPDEPPESASRSPIPRRSARAPRRHRRLAPAGRVRRDGRAGLQLRAHHGRRRRHDDHQAGAPRRRWPAWPPARSRWRRRSTPRWPARRSSLAPRSSCERREILRHDAQRAGRARRDVRRQRARRRARARGRRTRSTATLTTPCACTRARSSGVDADDLPVADARRGLVVPLLRRRRSPAAPAAALSASSRWCRRSRVSLLGAVRLGRPRHRDHGAAVVVRRPAPAAARRRCRRG